MIRRLIEANYFANRDEPTLNQIRFWLEEMRTPELIMEAVERFPEEAAEAAATRSPVAAAVSVGDQATVEEALRTEERLERESDREYWAPLKAELERLRHSGK